jgi:hypothetical protein
MGFEFFKSDNGVWLCEEVPPRYLSSQNEPRVCCLLYPLSTGLSFAKKAATSLEDFSMAQQIDLDEQARADAGAQQDGTHEVAPDLAYQRLAIVNVAFVGLPGSNDWVLIDAGPMKSASAIMGAAQKRFGNAPPRAIVMTHGHFDHFGSLETLLESWDVPVYVHELEAPYFRGEASYPPPDPALAVA